MKEGITLNIGKLAACAVAVISLSQTAFATDMGRGYGPPPFEVEPANGVRYWQREWRPPRDPAFRVRYAGGAHAAGPYTGPYENYYPPVSYGGPYRDWGPYSDGCREAYRTYVDRHGGAVGGRIVDCH